MYAPDASPVAGEAAEPVLSLAEAKAAHAAATAKLVLVQEARQRAHDRLAALERDAARFATLDDRIRRTLIEST